MRAGAGRAGDVTGKLMIHLGPSESAALGLAAISTAALADMVLTYWKAHPAVARAPTRLQSGMQKA